LERCWLSGGTTPEPSRSRRFSRVPATCRRLLVRLPDRRPTRRPAAYVLVTRDIYLVDFARVTRAIASAISAARSSVSRSP
jgi:hypothetical protein